MNRRHLVNTLKYGVALSLDALYKNCKRGATEEAGDVKEKNEKRAQVKGKGKGKERDGALRG